MTGKKKCGILRKIRQRIAAENDIPFSTEECGFKGECTGTCPKCESELSYLEAQLERCRSLGKRVTVSALALGVAAAGLTGCRAQIVGYPEELDGEIPYEETATDAGEGSELLGEVSGPSDASARSVVTGYHDTL